MATPISNSALFRALKYLTEHGHTLETLETFTSEEIMFMYTAEYAELENMATALYEDCAE